MKRKYTILPFGEKEKRIRVVLCRKPMAQGLNGMVRGKDLPHDLAILVDKPSDADPEYLHAALVGTAEMVIAVRMTPAVFHGIRSGAPIARTCLFHELGHFAHKHMETPGFQTEAYDKERYKIALSEGVAQQELEADAFAAEYLGNNVVAEGLSVIRSLHEKELNDGVHIPEEVTVSMRELDFRIAVLKGNT